MMKWFKLLLSSLVNMNLGELKEIVARSGVGGESWVPVLAQPPTVVDMRHVIIPR